MSRSIPTAVSRINNYPRWFQTRVRLPHPRSAPFGNLPSTSTQSISEFTPSFPEEPPWEFSDGRVRMQKRYLALELSLHIFLSCQLTTFIFLFQVS